MGTPPVITGAGKVIRFSVNENFEGNDPLQLAHDTRKCYQYLLKDGEGMSRQLTLVLKILRSMDKNNYQAAVSAFNVEVPGK